MKFVIKLFPEIIVKSRPVRKQFIAQLRKNLKKILSPLLAEPKIQGSWDLIELDIDLSGKASDLHSDKHLEEQVISRLQSTPGIDFILKVKVHHFETLDDIAKIVVLQYAEEVKNQTFCVRIKRTGQHSFNSIEAERFVGGSLFNHSDNAGVKLKNPQVTVQLEIRGEQLFTVVKRIQGLGGFPMGQQESCVSLISGGFDSSVASYLMMKRGIRTHFCFFNLGGLAHEVGVKQVAHYLWQKYSSSHRTLFISIPFEKVVSEILTKIDHRLMGVVLKRMMLRVANQIAVEFNSSAVVTGEAVGQVSSQTLTNLAVIDKVCDGFVMRPLIVMDKPDIIALSRQIGVEEFAATMPEYCGVISSKPTTRAKLGKVESDEKRFDFSILQQAFDSRKVENIDQVYAISNKLENVQSVSLPEKNDIIIDIRHPHEQAIKPLELTTNQVLAIPFFKLQSSTELNQQQSYLLYCDKGVMSQLQAEELLSRGYQVKIYQPDLSRFNS